jgi:cytochrome c biogenesis protein ResB
VRHHNAFRRIAILGNFNFLVFENMIYFILIIILISIALLICTISLFKANLKLKQEAKARKKQEARNEKIDKETLSKIDAVTSGDSVSAFDSGISVLHELAGK